MLGRICLMWLNKKVIVNLGSTATYTLLNTIHRSANAARSSSTPSWPFSASRPPNDPPHVSQTFIHRLEVTVWVVPSLVGNAISVAFIGLLLGPMYPILMNHSTSILPRWLLTGCMGYIAGVGQAGSAVLPFLTGLLASKFGIASLQPL